MSIVYGPVPSWRLGRSLGIDLISAQGKTCTFDCVYCQLGRTTCSTDQRQVFVETEQLRAELAALPPVEVDYVTFSGTGEPALAANLGEAMDLVSQWSAPRGLPTAVLTNASLLSRPSVRRDLARIDLVVAKLDAPDEMLFQAISRPVEGVTWPKVLDGIRALRQEFDGRFALQMMFVAANRDRAADMAALARSLDPDEVQLNTPLRPSPTPPLSRAAMAEIEAAFAGLPVISVYAAPSPEVDVLDEAEMHRRRPAEGLSETTGREVN
jgi:wyosine [tRNA(Phe)-imidazoG37] synthetase (radical SAM superfamily)